MDGIHDMGGMHGFGKVEPEANEPVFHAPWEGRCLALNRAMGAIGAWTIDEGRAGIEELPPDVYLASSYYGKWALRLENMVVARGLAGADELAAGHALHAGQAAQAQAYGRRHSADADARLVRPAGAGARALQGRRSRAHQEISIRRPTRACRAMRAAMSASIEAIRGCHVFPDSTAVGSGENPQWLYTVLFEAPRIVGRQRRSDAYGFDRGVRAVSGGGA